MLRYIVLYCIVLYGIILHCIVLYCIILYYIILYYIILYYIILYYIIIAECRSFHENLRFYLIKLKAVKLLRSAMQVLRSVTYGGAYV